MKRTLLVGMVALSMNVATLYGQGVIKLDNYNTSGPNVLYGSGWGVLSGTGLDAGWTAGFYWAPGNVTGSVGNDPTGFGVPGFDFADGGLQLATGSGSTAAFYTSTFSTAGQFLASSAFVTPGATAGNTITIMLLAYTGGSGYASAQHRGHSTPFTMTVSDANNPSPNLMGDYMPAFSISIPEPSLFTLIGLGSIAFFISRRK